MSQPQKNQNKKIHITAIDIRIKKLEEELAIKCEHLQFFSRSIETTNQELECDIKKLKSNNKKLEARNKELQTTNEELKTINAELCVSNKALIVKEKELEATLETALRVAEQVVFEYNFEKDSVPINQLLLEFLEISSCRALRSGGHY